MVLGGEMAEEETPKEKVEGKPHSGIPEAIFLVSHIRGRTALRSF